MGVDIAEFTKNHKYPFAIQKAKDASENQQARHQLMLFELENRQQIYDENCCGAM